ncbi:MAG: hypothetical protein RLZZ269_2166, partial [Actinomycetota bacterium]
HDGRRFTHLTYRDVAPIVDDESTKGTPGPPHVSNRVGDGPGHGDHRGGEVVGVKAAGRRDHQPRGVAMGSWIGRDVGPQGWEFAHQFIEDRPEPQLHRRLRAYDGIVGTIGGDHEIDWAVLKMKSPVAQSTDVRAGHDSARILGLFAQETDAFVGNDVVETANGRAMTTQCQVLVARHRELERSNDGGRGHMTE